ncbi:MAG: hypothetical protein PHS96_00850 [Anaerolineales bacterium]|nr:hypothetical protein [Anaerolineales bacterium]
MANLTKSSRNTWLWVAGTAAGLVIICCLLVAAGALLYPAITRSQTAFSFLSPTVQDVTVQTALPFEATAPLPSEQAPTQALPPTQESTATPSEAPPNLSYEGISLSFAPAVAAGAQGQIVPASAPGSESDFPGSVYPEYYQVKFSGYPLVGAFHEAQILVYPAAEYAALDASAAQVILNLTQTLAAKPAQAEHMPFLPIWPAAQLMRSNVEYLAFKNGAGVRYLTQYGQASWPMNNHDLFYTFQGLTGNGMWYVAAILPVSHPTLPATGDTVPGGDYESFLAGYEAYIVAMQAQLSAQPEESFTPSLTLLDAMFASLRVK